MYFVPRLSPSATQGLRAERKGGGGTNKEEWEKQTREMEEDGQKNQMRERRVRGEAEREVAGKQKNTALANYKLKA